MDSTAGGTRNPGRDVVIAPEVADAIRSRRASGELVADIGRSLGMTPLEVLRVLGSDPRQVK